jgi:hypothetical protein
MWKLEAQSFIRTQRMMSELAAIGASDPNWLYERVDWISSQLDQLEPELTKLNLPVSRKMILSIRALCQTAKPQLSFTSLMTSRIAELRARIEDEIETRYLFAVSADSARYLDRSKSILSTEIEATFPESIFDLHEAADCIGLSRFTASVFHLMRAMEIAIARVGGHLGATVVNADGKGLPWGVLVANIKARVDQMPAGSEKDEWQTISAMFYAVKEAWRNNTMHPKQTYTEEEAIEVFDAVRTFLRRLSIVLN